jgi:hypothetical protein
VFLILLHAIQHGLAYEKKIKINSGDIGYRIEFIDEDNYQQQNMILGC